MKETKLLFFYSLFAVLFLFISSSMSVKNTFDIVYVALIVPIIIYLVFSLFGVIDTPQVPVKKRYLLPAIVLAIVMSVFAISNFDSEKEVVEDPIPFSSPFTIPSTTTNQQRTIVVTQSTNIRDGASLTSEIIGQANEGEVFDYNEPEGEWYKVFLDDDQIGYIHKDFITEQ